jgi:hypothetical protein
MYEPGANPQSCLSTGRDDAFDKHPRIVAQRIVFNTDGKRRRQAVKAHRVQRDGPCGIGHAFAPIQQA